MSLYYSKRFMRITMLAILVVLTGAFTAIILLSSDMGEPNRVVINEVCSNNFSLTESEDERYCDYIELYNSDAAAVSLAGYYLSDDENELQKYALDSITILPKGYSVIWLDGTDYVDTEQIGFKISKLGEEIFLSKDSEEESIDESMTGLSVVDSVIVPELSYNTSYGRANDGEEIWGRMNATVGRSNNEAEILPAIELSEPVFSAESGFYDEAFSLTIKSAENEIIYYTLDGSNPTLDSSIYETPLTIKDASEQENVYSARTDLSPTREYIPSFSVDKATVVRAISYNIQENTVSQIASKVYFVGYDSKDEYTNFPIISIVTDSDNLFDAETGIYGNGVKLEAYKAEGGLKDGELLQTFTSADGVLYHLYESSNAFNEGKEWEREASISYFDAAHEYQFTQGIGIRIAGASSRATPKKSFSIYGRDIYDENVFLQYEFFPDTNYSTIKLRNGGSRNEGVMITDAFLEEQAVSRDVSIQRSEPCIVFLNGEYWGIYNIRERYTEEYFSNHYNVDQNNLWVIDGSTVKIGGSAAQEAYQYMIDVITECDLSYDDVYAMVCDIIDVQSLIDYYCIQLYVDNRDVSFVQNTALWRTAEAGESEYEDGKWRWMLFDLDLSIYEDSNSLSLDWMRGTELFNEPVLVSLMDNEEFRKQFCITFMDIANTIYSYDTVHKELMEWQETYTTQMVKSHQRFFDPDFMQEDYNDYIQEMDDFFKGRFPFAMNSLAQEFGLSGSLETITIRSNIAEAGTIVMNTVQVDTGEAWSGSYFTDYPISLSAIANEGYRFVGWGGDVSEGESQIEVNILKGGMTISAIFEKAE